MRLISDYHTHSKYSRFFHGRNKIMEMAISANAMGLNEIGITDHGFKHFFRTNKAKLKKARAEIDEINTWSRTKVLLGVEADIISEDGKLDVDNETLAMLDILVIGYHRMIKTDFAGFFGNVSNTEEARKRCTKAFINAINSYPVTIVSHLDSVLKTDLYEIGCACRDNNVLVEINNRHSKWTKEQVEALVASGCLFVVSSDAHRREDVGKVDNAFDIIRKFEIPTEYVINVEFSLDEKSEDHKEADYYYSIYQQKQSEKQEEIAANEYKKKTEFTESLSDEMEKALMEIAAEKGIEYNRPTEKSEEPEQSDFVKAINFVEDDDIIERAKEHIAKLERMQREAEEQRAQEVQTPAESLSEIKEQFEENAQADVHESAEPVEEAEPEEDSENPVIAALKDFHAKSKAPKEEPQVVEEVEEEIYEEPAELVEEVKPAPVQIVDTTRSNNLGIFNSVISEIKGTNKKAEPKEEEKKEEKPKEEPKKRKSFGGFMGAGGIVGTAEDNKTSKTDK